MDQVIDQVIETKEEIVELSLAELAEVGGGVGVDPADGSGGGAVGGDGAGSTSCRRTYSASLMACAAISDLSTSAVETIS